MQIIDKAVPIFEFVRSAIMRGAEFVGSSFNVPTNNVYILLIAIISLWLPTIFYSAIKQKLNTWIIVSAIIFAILKFV